MFSSCEEFSFSIIYVSVLIDTKIIHLKEIQELLIRNKVFFKKKKRQQGKTQIVKQSKSYTRSISAVSECFFYFNSKAPDKKGQQE